MPAWLMSNCSPASLFAPNFPHLPAWSPLTVVPCRPCASQMPFPAGHLVVAILCPHGCRIFDHMGVAILCVGVMVNLHITLLLDRILPTRTELIWFCSLFQSSNSNLFFKYKLLTIWIAYFCSFIFYFLTYLRLLFTMFMFLYRYLMCYFIN